MQIGPYQVLSELGRGGMGVVYEVAGPQGQRYALKRLRTESNTDDQLRLRRIGRELQALGQIQHPGVVRALDSGWDAGAFYIVMELVRSPSLGARVQRQGPLPPREAAALCFGIAQTLQALHAQGILHRDVKPDNVLVDAGRPRLTDLGLVQLYDDQEQLTQTGAAIGTPGFSAPELLSKRHGVKPTAAVDIYGLGATLYALLTGHAPFEAGSPYETAVQTLEAEVVPPSRRLSLEASDANRRGEVARFDAICLRCLAKDPTDRYPSAQAVGVALEEAMRDEDVDEEESGGGALLPIAVIAVLGLLFGVTYALLTPEDDLEPLPVASASPTPIPSASAVPSPRVTPAAKTPAAKTPAAKTPAASPSQPSARLDEFLADAPQATPATFPVEGPGDLGALGQLADPVWLGLKNGWAVTRYQDGFVGLRNTNPKAPGLTIRYFEIRRNPPVRPLKASVSVLIAPGADYVAAGLIYGRTELRSYYLVGINQEGTRFVKQRSKAGLVDKIQGRVPAGLHSFGVAEEADRLSISCDGRTLMKLGGAADPKARVGVFVIGFGLVKVRDFAFELRQPK